MRAQVWNLFSMRGKMFVPMIQAYTAAFVTTHTNTTPPTQYDANLLNETPGKNTVIAASLTFSDDLTTPLLFVYSKWYIKLNPQWV